MRPAQTRRLARGALRPGVLGAAAVAYMLCCPATAQRLPPPPGATVTKTFFGTPVIDSVASFEQSANPEVAA